VRSPCDIVATPSGWLLVACDISHTVYALDPLSGGAFTIARVDRPPTGSGRILLGPRGLALRSRRIHDGKSKSGDGKEGVNKPVVVARSVGVEERPVLRSYDCLLYVSDFDANRVCTVTIPPWLCTEPPDVREVEQTLRLDDALGWNGIAKDLLTLIAEYATIRRHRHFDQPPGTAF
jgi:hypothetical protein